MFLQSTIFTIFLSSLALSATPDVELQLLHVVFRHGDKVPHREFQNYPNDPYRDYSYYPMGNGDLTNQGKMREYKIGTMLRERYDQYFGLDYWPSKIYARSSEVPRTQLSLQLVLAGLFPPSEKQTWNPHLPWIPTWTFFVPYKTDNLLFPHYCYRYMEEYQRFLQLDAKEMINNYKNVMDYLTDHSGKLINTTEAVGHLYNLLKEESAQNLTLPKWTQNVFPSPMIELIELDFKLRSYTKTLKKLNGGMLLRKIVDDIREHQAGKSPRDRKAFLFGGHEFNVAALAYTLGTNEPTVPPYGATIILETLRDKKGIYYIRVLLWSGVTEQLKVQTIPDCTEICPFEDFLRIVKDVLPSDDEYYCRRDKTEDLKKNAHHRSSAACIAYDKTSWYIFLAVLFAFTSKFVQK
ncbi:PREDICTED: venom acid phosphatase Acph-1-like isoform X1 [Trachymyrmex cornetzi]|uniref:acid phosphatase n=2 Tax=Trachymyrmex cornetzi TaxID=471704 RepID=A0A151J5U1_9HYME|nr:PREDICTED: venom acid phosphatase Acph-1-like isoform X1 [Trachymyrmex cornetzi]KYN18413.1 Venom acid phosphatase Acph-1 [Trachymyrmex cornetzi]